MAEGRKKRGNAAVWAVLGLLVLALGGFGIGGFGGEVRTVATVGDEEVTTGDYARALQQEQQRLAQVFGQQPSLQQMQMFGLDRQVMERLLAAAALAHETEVMGVSVGDAEVAARIRAQPSFQGLSGQFDREAYAFALRQTGLSEREFEARVRQDAAREILQAAVIAGAEPPPGYAAALAAWLSETRDVTVAEVTANNLDAGAVAATEAQLETFLGENAARFEVPERRRITFAWITPEMLAPTLAVDEAQIEALYADRAGELSLPARVLAERLAFADSAAAQEAAEAIVAGETTFDALVEARGLTLDDVDQGEIAEADVDPAVAAALFALDEPGIVGPVETPLGPALYRVNAILDARETPLDEIRDELAAEAAQDEARRRIDAAREEVDDLLAGGATLEELAGETLLELGEIAYDPSVSEGIAGYETFREAAAAAAEGDFPELLELSDGGLFALRLDAVDPAALPPLADIRPEVEAAWQAADITRRLEDRARALAERLRAGEDFEALGLAPETVSGIERDGGIADTPRDVVDRIFEAGAGEVLAAPGDDRRAFVVRIDAVNAADEAALAPLVDQIEDEARGQVVGDLFEAYARAAQAQAGFEVNAQAKQAVEAQLLGGL